MLAPLFSNTLINFWKVFVKTNMSTLSDYRAKVPSLTLCMSVCTNMISLCEW